MKAWSASCTRVKSEEDLSSENTYLSVKVGIHNRPDTGVEGRKPFQSVGQHQQHAVGIAETTSCVGIQTFQVGDGIGFGRRTNDLKERFDGVRVL